MSSPWQASEEDVVRNLTSGRSVLFVGGRGSGVSTLVTSVQKLLSDRGHCVVNVLRLYEGAAALDGPERLVSELLGQELDRLPSVLEAAAVVKARVTESDCTSFIALLDGTHLLGRQEWGVALAEFLRALLNECGGRAVLGLFGRPSLDLMFAAESSPLSNVCTRLLAAPADGKRVRDYYAKLGDGPDIVMRALRAVGGSPSLLPDMVRALRVQPLATAIEEVARQRVDFLSAQFRDLSPLASEALLAIAERPLTVDAIRVHLAGAEPAAVLRELEATLLCSQVGGQVALSSEVHRSWLAKELVERATRSRRRLSFLDEEAHRLISGLEWHSREWLSRQLSMVSADWWEERIPPEPRRRAEERRDLEVAAPNVEASAHTVDYLDFTDIREILRFSNNWRTAFAVVLDEWREALEEALRRIEAIRRKVAHSRPLSEAEYEATARDIRFVRECFTR